MNKFQELGQRLADEYLSRNNDLTASLVKLAEQESLNTQQIKRVAEIANVETYLKLAEVSPNGYVEFPLADADKVIKAFNKKAELLNDVDISGSSASQHSSILEDQWKDIITKHDNKHTVINEEGELKTASAEGSQEGSQEDIDEFTRFQNKDNETYKSLQKVAVLSASVMKKTAETKEYEAALFHNYYILRDLVKQAMLEGYSFGDVTNVIEKAATADSSKLQELLKQEMKDYFITRDLEKEAGLQTELEVDTESELFKSASMFDMLAKNYVHTVQELGEDATEMLKLSNNNELTYYIKEATRHLTTHLKDKFDNNEDNHYNIFANIINKLNK